MFFAARKLVVTEGRVGTDEDIIFDGGEVFVGAVIRRYPASNRPITERRS